MTRSASTTESLERTLEQTLAEILARRGNREALAEVTEWLSGGRSASVGATAFRILLEAAPTRKHTRLIDQALHNAHYHLVREAAIESALAMGDPALHLAIAHRLFDRSDIVQRAARTAILTLPLDDEIGRVLMDMIAARYVAPAEWGEDVPCVVVPAMRMRLDDSDTKALKYRERARVYALECACRPHRIAGLADVLLTLLDGEDGMLRSYAARALEFVPDGAAVMPQLIHRLGDGRDVNLQLSALSALGRLRQRAALATLERYLEHRDLRLQRAAASGIGRLPDGAGQELLERKWRSLRGA